MQFQPNLLFFRGRIHQIFNLTKIEKISPNSLFASLSEASIKLHLVQENVKLRLEDLDFVLRMGVRIKIRNNPKELPQHHMCTLLPSYPL